LKDSFAGYNNLGWQLCPFMVDLHYAMPSWLLGFLPRNMFFFLMCLPLHLTWQFSLAAFKIFCLVYLVF
jgi:hypothetical protein